MRTVYLGTSHFAVRVLDRLAASPHKPALVVTPPDRPRGRGRRLAPPPVAAAARELGIELLQTPNVSDAEVVARIDGVAPGAIAVCQFGQLIKEPLLSRYLMLNVHTSMLPRWRGAAPVERALMAGDEETGVTIFRVTAGLDSGPVALACAEPIRADDTAGTLSERLAVLGGELLVEALDAAEAGTLELIDQPPDGATYAEKVTPAERRLDPGRPAAELERQVRALTPAIGAYLQQPGGERLGVSAARVTAGDVPAGEVASADGRLLLGTSDGALELLEVTPPGRRPMDAAAYLRGHRMP
jgi:methionyl-tRNA formyltransferase